jgi:hypothetical protein
MNPTRTPESVIRTFYRNFTTNGHRQFWNGSKFKSPNPTETSRAINYSLVTEFNGDE